MANLKVGNTNVGRISVIEPYDDSTPSDNDEVQPWVRPDYWLDMPVMNSGDEKVSLLLAIPSGTHNPVRIDLKGTYVNGGNSDTYSPIDWGDGTSGILQGRANADLYLEHTYNFEDLDESTQFVKNGLVQRQALLNIDNSASGCWYLSLIRLGPNQTTDGSLAKYGVDSRLLELNIASDTMTSLQTYYNGQYPIHRNLERVKLIGDLQISPYQLFIYCDSLQSLEYPSGAFLGGTNATNMFFQCEKLKTIPYFSSSHITSFNGSFGYCNSLEEPPELDTSSNTSFRSTFNYCHKLKRAGNYDWSNVVDAYSTYRDCYKLSSIPSGLDYSSVTNMQYMFLSCFKLGAVPSDFFSTTTNVQNARSLFGGCKDLTYVPPINLPSATEANSLLSSCMSLKEATVENLSSVTTANYGLNTLFGYCKSLEKVNWNNPEQINASRLDTMFLECENLKVAPYFNTASGEDFTRMFEKCYNLIDVPVYDLTSATTVTSMFNSCYNLKKVAVNTQNSASLTNYYNMFSNCTNLQEYPSGLFGGNNHTKYLRHMYYSRIEHDFKENIVASGYYAFEFNHFLRSVENLTPSGDCQQMFRYCGNLRHLGDLDFTHVTNLTNWLYGGSSRLEWSDIKNVNVNISYDTTALSSGAIEHVLNNLPTVSSTTSISFANCWGAQNLHPDTLSIATSKGWTVTT